VIFRKRERERKRWKWRGGEGEGILRGRRGIEREERERGY